jgi:hypothetical protein
MDAETRRVEDIVDQAMVDCLNLTERFYKEFVAIQARRPDFRAEMAEHIMTRLVFHRIRDSLGEARAREIFGPLGPRTKRKDSEIRNEDIARQYGWLGKPSKAEFARRMAAKNKGKPRRDRVGSGSDDPDNMLRYVKRVLQQKRYSEIADKWCGRKRDK